MLCKNKMKQGNEIGGFQIECQSSPILRGRHICGKASGRDHSATWRRQILPGSDSSQDEAPVSAPEMPE